MGCYCPVQRRRKMHLWVPNILCLDRRMTPVGYHAAQHDDCSKIGDELAQSDQVIRELEVENTKKKEQCTFLGLAAAVAASALRFFILASPSFPGGTKPSPSAAAAARSAALLVCDSTAATACFTPEDTSNTWTYASLSQ